MDRILVPLDGSRLSEAILPVVEALTRDSAAQILLLRSIGLDDVPGPEAEVRQRADAYLSSVAAGMKAGGQAEIRWTVWYGDPPQVILNAAAREAATLIAMGAHGRAGLHWLRLGSVADAVVRHAPIPVLLIRGELTRGNEGAGSILVPLDGSERAEAILPTVERLTGPLRRPLELLHVIEPRTPARLGEAGAVAPIGASMDRRQPEAQSYLAAIAARLAGRGCRASVDVREGTPVDVISQSVAAAGSSLIAMSTHGHGGISRLMLGSVAASVLRATSAPVLLWKAPEERPPEPR